MEANTGMEKKQVWHMFVYREMLPLGGIVSKAKTFQSETHLEENGLPKVKPREVNVSTASCKVPRHVFTRT